MSEKIERTVNDIHKDYSQACADAGHLQYKIHVNSSEIEMLKAELSKLNGRLRDLNLEASAIQAKEAESKEKNESQS